MGILIRSLLSLSFFNSIVQKLNSFLIFFFKFSFDALILNILKSIHLEIILRLLNFSINCVISSNRLVHSVRHITSCVLNHLVFLSFLSHLSEFYVTFIENYFLNIMRRHLSHEKTLSISIFVTLNDFIFETDEL